MDAKRGVEDDAEAGILYLALGAPYPEQETEELADKVIARINPDTNELESLEVLFFSTRLEENAVLELPVEGNFRLTSRR